LNAHINKGIRLIAKNPLIGMQTDYPEVRTLVTGNYQIIYEITEDIVLIAMVWDCRRNPDEKRPATSRLL